MVQIEVYFYGRCKILLTYYLANNNKLIDKIDVDKVYEMIQFNEGLVDDRHDIFCTNIEVTVDSYLEYLKSVRIIEQESKVKGKYYYLLELGYMPVVMPPFYYKESMHEIIIPKLKENNIPMLTLPASSLTKPVYSNPTQDVWVSKMDVYQMLKCKPEEVTVKKLLEAIL